MLTQSGLKCIIPIVKSGKKSLIDWAIYQQRTPTEEEIKNWKTVFPNSNWALITGRISGIVVLDCDSQEAFDFVKRKGVPNAPMVKTGRGYHIYFKNKNMIRGLQSVAGRKDIQLKAEGGYVLIPPSIHITGAMYKWMDGAESIDLPELPHWILDNHSLDVVPFQELYKGIAEGGRNSALARLMGSWVNDGLSINECLEMAELWNQRNSPPLSDDELKRTVESIFKGHYLRHPELCDKQDVNPPEELNSFLKRDIPPVEYFIKDIIQKNGRTMISAPTNVGKSILVQNIAVALIWDKTMWERFEVKAARVLYLDCEMGESLLKDRFQKMVETEFIEPEGIFVKTIMGMDLLNNETQKKLEQWIRDFRINVLIIDPIGSAWHGDENDKKEVNKVTSYLDTLLSPFNLSIVIVHHWRKSTRDSKSGGEMASGSYKWSAWVDIHLTLNGIAENLTVECHKSRASKRFPPFRIKLNPQTMKFDYLGDFTKKFTDDTLLKVFESFNQERVSIPAMIKKAGELKMGSEETIRKLIKCSKFFKIDNSAKIHYLEKVSIKIEPLDDPQISELDGIG